MANPGTPETLSDAFHKFLITSTIRGVPKIVKEKTIIWRLIWIVAVLSFSSIAGYFVCESIQDYLRYRETMYEQMADEEEMGLPLLTICDHRKKSYDQHWQTFSKHNVSSIDAYFAELQRLLGILIESDEVKDMRDVQVKMKYIDYLREKNVNIFSPDKHFFISCRASEPFDFGGFAKENCRWDFFSLWDGTGCYNIGLYSNTSLHFENNVVVELVLNIGPGNYVDEYGDETVLTRIYTGLQEPLVPGQYHMGYSVPRGFSRALVVSGKIKRQINTPVKKCLQEPPKYHIFSGQDYKVADWHKEYDYSLRRCQLIGYQQFFNLEFKCYLPMLPVIQDRQSKDKRLRNCFDIKTPEEYVNLINKGIHFLTEHLETMCQKPCESKRYSVSKNLRPWPSLAEQIKMYRNYIKPSKRFPEFDVYENISKIFDKDYKAAEKLVKNLDLFQTNFARARIHVSKDNFRIINYGLLETWVSLLSKVGGQCSLWVGVTFIAGIEIIQLISDVFCIILKKIGCFFSSQSRKHKGKTYTDNRGHNNSSENSKSGSYPLVSHF